jgi:hypothetical protein
MRLAHLVRDGRRLSLAKLHKNYFPS